MIQSSLLHLMQTEFHRLRGMITYVMIAIMSMFALLLWWLGIEMQGHMATFVGAVVMLLAVFTFNIPYITYRYMLNKYKNEPAKLSALGPNWHEFRDHAMQRE